MKSSKRAHTGWILFCACFAGFTWQLDLYSVSIALPAISRGFGIGTDMAVLMTVCYSLLLSSSLLVAGRLEDMLGLRRVLIWGFLIFAAGAAAASLSPSEYLLIAAHSIQGIAGAILVSSAYAMVRVYLPPGKRGSGFGLVSGTAALGIAVGTSLGGAIVGWFSWRGVFVFELCLGLAGAGIALRSIPHAERKRGTSWSDFDFTGAVLSFFSVFFLLLAVNRAGRLGWGSPYIITGLALSIFLVATFIFREKKSSAPLVNPALFRGWRTVFAFLVGVLMFAALSGNAFLMPFYLELYKGMDTRSVGFVFLIYSLTLAVVSPIAGRIVDSVSPRKLVTAALFAGMGACLFFAARLAIPGNTNYLVFLSLIGLSAGLFFPPNNHAVMRHALKGEEGSLSSLYSVFNNLGWAMGACILEAVFAHTASSNPEAAGHSGIPRTLLAEGFRISYILAAAFILCAMILSAILLARRHSPGPPAKG